MGKKTVRWNKLKSEDRPGFRCGRCDNVGIVQEIDYIYGDTHYVYCNCKFGKQEEEAQRKERG